MWLQVHELESWHALAFADEISEAGEISGETAGAGGATNLRSWTLLFVSGTDVSHDNWTTVALWVDIEFVAGVSAGIRGMTTLNVEAHFN